MAASRFQPPSEGRRESRNTYPVCRTAGPVVANLRQTPKGRKEDRQALVKRRRLKFRPRQQKFRSAIPSWRRDESMGHADSAQNGIARVAKLGGITL